jgi:hypothetical protein
MASVICAYVWRQRPHLPTDTYLMSFDEVTEPRIRFAPSRAGERLLICQRPRPRSGFRPLASPRTPADKKHQDRLHAVRLASKTLHRSAIHPRLGRL